MTALCTNTGERGEGRPDAAGARRERQQAVQTARTNAQHACGSATLMRGWAAAHAASELSRPDVLAEAKLPPLGAAREPHGRWSVLQGTHQRGGIGAHPLR